MDPKSTLECRFNKTTHNPIKQRTTQSHMRVLRDKALSDISHIMCESMCSGSQSEN